MHDLGNFRCTSPGNDEFSTTISLRCKCILTQKRAWHMCFRAKGGKIALSLTKDDRQSPGILFQLIVLQRWSYALSSFLRLWCAV